MKLVDLVLTIARGQLGVTELSAANDGVPSTRYMGGRKEPWCAHWVAWVFRSAGMPLPGDVVPSSTRANPIASVATMEKECRRRGWWHDGEPVPGDVVFFFGREASDTGPGRHVGLVEEVTPTMLKTIEGNTGNGVRRRTYVRLFAAKKISGYGRLPELAANDNVEQPTTARRAAGSK